MPARTKRRFFMPQEKWLHDNAKNEGVFPLKYHLAAQEISNQLDQRGMAHEIQYHAGRAVVKIALDQPKMADAESADRLYNSFKKQLALVSKTVGPRASFDLDKEHIRLSFFWRRKKPAR